ATCHPAAESELATDNLLPKPSMCVDCHDDADVRGYWSLEESVDLETYARPAKDDRLFFSHKGPAADLEMACVECHVGIEEDVAEGVPAMALCARCHNNADATAPIVASAAKHPRVISATNQCEACHTTLAGLHPKNHRVPNFMQDHGKF